MLMLIITVRLLVYMMVCVWAISRPRSQSLKKVSIKSKRTCIFIWMRAFVFLCLGLLLCTQGWAQNTLQFPQDFFGKYTGTLKIHTQRGDQDVPMEFHLLPTDSTATYQYTLIYGTGEQRQERAYVLLEEDLEKGRFAVDELNGIVLDNKFHNNRLYALFEVQGNLLTTFITFEPDHAIFEIVFANKSSARETYAVQDSIQVLSYPITTVQRALLQKQ